jgi:nucleotide-binding universal stress UspA family protein
MLTARRRGSGPVERNAGGDQAMSTPTIVVGYDGSECARAALAEAVRIATERRTGLTVAFGYGVEPMGGEASDHRKALHEFGEARLREGMEQIGPSGIAAETVCVDARPADALLRLADDRGAQMIVVGNHGESPLVGAILGSVPHKLLHRARVPVLVVPGPEGS